MSYGHHTAAPPAPDEGALHDAGLRVTVAAWLATLAAGASLLPLVAGTDWLVQAGALLGAQAGAGMLLRWRGVPGGVTVLLQAALSLLLLTLVTVPGQAVGGVLPGPEALERLGSLLRAGTGDIGRYVAPAPVTDGIRLLLLGGVLLIGLLVDLLAVTLRSAAASGLPLLALYSVAAGVSQSEAAWPYFLCAAAGYLLLVLAEGTGRLTRWGRYFAGPPLPGYPPAAPGAAPRRAPGPRVRTGRRIGAVTLGVAVAAPLLLPALGDGLLGLQNRGGGSGGGPDALTAVDPVVGLQDQLNQPENRPVLRYRTDSPEPLDMYLRLVALDEFDGDEWRSSDWHEDEPTGAPWPVPGLTDASATNVTTSVEALAGYAQTSLPVPYPAVGLAGEDAWWEDWLFDRGSQTLVSGDGETVEGHRYQVRHLAVAPSEEQLAAAPEPPPDVQEYYTRLPDDLPPEVRGTALSVTEGADSDYERAIALQEWFTQAGGFRYDTSVASGSGSDAIVNFLNDREGFCVHFAFTMAAMARALDIPAQVAVGFTPGALQADGSYVVGIHNAHAWPELYFQGVGWVRFEPTPGQGNIPPYTLPDDSATPGPSVAPGPSPQPEDEPSQQPAPPTPQPSAPDGCDPALEPSCVTPSEQTPESRNDAGLTVAWPVLSGGGGALLLAGLAAGPLLWRRRVRRHRLGPGAGPLAAWRELTDTAWDFGVSPAGAETPRQAAQRIVRVTRLGGQAAAAVHRVADAVELELYAPGGPARAGGELAADVRGASDAVRAGAGRRARLRALLLPRSAMRVIAALTERRVAASERLAGRIRRAVPRRWRQRA